MKTFQLFYHQKLSVVIPHFMLRIHKNLLFQTFHYRAKCHICRLSKNQVNIADTWLTLAEIPRYLNSASFDHKKDILSRNNNNP